MNLKKQISDFFHHLASRQREFLLIMSILAGAASGLAAVLLKRSVHFVEQFVANFSEVNHQNYLYLFMPLLGLLITALFIRYFIKDDITHGVSRILQAISKHEGKIRRHNTYSSIAACSVTVGFGGSVGMEAPILYTGAAIGSNIAMAFKQNYRIRVLLIGAGVAGAMSAIFKAPIAGIIFAVEVLMIDMSMVSMMPLIISSLTAALVSTFLLGEKLTFYFALTDAFHIEHIHLHALLGVFCGLVSLYFLWVNEQIERQIQSIRPAYLRIAVSGVLLGALIFLFPPLFGEGYSSMKLILSGNIGQLANNSFFYDTGSSGFEFLSYLFLILIFKVIATSLTTGSGGIGGVFAPALFMGGVTGALFARTVNLYSSIRISESNFTLIGMAGLISGVIHAPLTAIFLIAEITGGYQLFIPLIITSLLAYLTVNLYQPHSIYTKKLAAKGELITHDKDKAVLTLLHVSDVIETNFISLHPDDSLGKLVQAISKSKRNIFPVVEKNGKLLGVVTLDDVRTIMFDKENYEKIAVSTLMTKAEETVNVGDTMETVMNTFTGTGNWNLPVVEHEKYVGFVSRANVFNFYRQKLQEFQGDYSRQNSDSI